MISSGNVIERSVIVPSAQRTFIFYFLAHQEIHFENEEWRTLLGE